MRRLARFIFYMLGWKIQGSLPEIDKYVIIMAPHTSNWDFVVGLLISLTLGLKLAFVAKKQLFFFPLGIFLKAFGGVPLDRSKSNNFVQETVNLFKQRKKFVLAITPEGTRGDVSRWRSGFYYIACEAKVPIVKIAPDYQCKTVKIDKAFTPTGDIDADFPKILAYFKTVHGRYPKKIPDWPGSP